MGVVNYKLFCQCNKCNPFLPFTFLGVQKMQKNYVKLCKLRTCMGMQKKNLGDSLFFHELMAYFFFANLF
jgi:hypothetical protein